MSPHAGAESTRSVRHAPPEERRPMVDFDVDATCHDPMSSDVTFCAVAAGDVVVALDDGDEIATAIAIAAAVDDDARRSYHVLLLHDGDADCGDDCGPLGAMAYYGHCVANATNAAPLPDGHDDAAYDLAMPPAA